MVRTMGRIAKQVVKNPEKIATHAAKLAGNVLASMVGASEIEPEKGDRRFSDPAFEDNPFYRALKQSYLAWSKELKEWSEDIDLADRDKDRAQFLIGAMTDTMAPTNVLLGNPAALRETIDTNGQNLVTGFQNFIDDWKNNHGRPTQVDKSGFAVGENLATSPGEVVYSDDVVELIRYTPKTDKAYAVPIFFVPPPISKFYFFDLSENRSIIQFLVEQGFQVYAVSWFNPGPAQRAWNMTTYVKALERAADAGREISGSEKLHFLGACAGGVTSMIFAAYLNGKERDIIASVTLLVAVLDMDSTADTAIGLFAHLDTLEMAKGMSEKKGVVEGHTIQGIFAWLRPNDLIFSYWVNNYLMGKKPPSFDILYWNADAMNLTVGLQNDLIDMMKTNALIEHGVMEIDSVPIDLSKLSVDTYLVAGETDHITPWEGLYDSMKLMGGRKKFVLTTTGHVQSIIATPGNKKNAYMTNAKRPDSASEWRENAKMTRDSWWFDWAKWLKRRSGELSAEHTQPKTSAYKALGPAPGKYVLMSGSPDRQT